ncbi:hypothetical protein CCMA1212_005391 [Trichoderma ghanense]|uniref:Uncharacterized protein n=1 Tax=Trichoderma ghanense TaxID=65468 RepID=A0ABY2H5X5_9HYPO
MKHVRHHEIRQKAPDRRARQLPFTASRSLRDWPSKTITPTPHAFPSPDDAHDFPISPITTSIGLDTPSATITLNTNSHRYSTSLLASPLTYRHPSSSSPSYTIDSIFASSLRKAQQGGLQNLALFLTPTQETNKTTNHNSTSQLPPKNNIRGHSIHQTQSSPYLELRLTEVN